MQNVTDMHSKHYAKGHTANIFLITKVYICDNVV